MPRVTTSPRLRTPAKRPPPLQARRPSRLVLLWRRRRGLLFPALGTAVLLALGLVTAATISSLRPGHTVSSLQERLGIGAGLVVRDIHIEGRQKTPEDFLRAALGVSKGDKLLGFSLEAARRRIEKLTWVQHATVERLLPGTIIVKLEERRPFAVWQDGGKFHLIDHDGQVVVAQDPVKDAEAFQKLPLVVGTGAAKPAATLLDQLAALPSLYTRVAAAVRVGERRWNLQLRNGMDIMLPETGQAAALDRLMELQSKDDLLDRPLQFVDMRLPDRFVVRPIAAPKPDVPPGKRPS
jgi:cell division protein FtsQ